MSDLKNPLDKVFREKLGNYRMDPPEEIWTAIRSKTDKNRERRLVFIAWRVAAGIAIIITAGYTYYYLHRAEKPSITENLKNQQETLIKPETIDKTILSEKSDIPENKSNTGIPVNSKTVNRDESGINNTTKEITSVNKQEMVDEIVPGQSVPVAEQFKQEPKPNVYLSDLPYILKPPAFLPDRIPERKVSVEKFIMNLNTSLVFVEETTGKKDIWSLTAQISPTYNYRSLSKGDPNAISAFNESESGTFNYGGGLQLGLQASERLSLFAGLMYSPIGFEIRNIVSYQTDLQKTIGSEIIINEKIETNQLLINNSTGSISSQSPINEKAGITSSGVSYWGVNTAYADRLVNTDIVSNADKIDQYFQFIELPFMLRYKVFNRKLKMNLLGGLSTNVLVGNRVFLINGNDKDKIGATYGIRHINYSGNLGFGFDYDLGKNFLFTIEPQFKYYLNSINESVVISSRPYSIGMYTGIRYIF